MKSPKGKGNAHERWTSDKLSTWFGEPFKRIPSSGALRWHGVNADTFGDLLVPPSFKAVVECKHRKNFDMLATIGQKPGPGNLLGWWQQSVADADRCGLELKERRVPLLVAKGNRSLPVICFPASLGKYLPPLIRSEVVRPEIPSVWIVPFDHFLETVPRDTMSEAIEQWLGLGGDENGSNAVGST